MTGFSLVIEYLTGYAVATDPSSRENPEWPPHPARVFMALAAAHFETDGSSEDKRAERESLEWLATLSPPELVIPPHTARDVLSVYVPVNDQNGGDALIRRSRQPRTFPRVYVGNEPVRLIWRIDPAIFPQHIRSLQGICRLVTRIGHSSSLVWVRLEQHASASPSTLVPDEHALQYRFRVVNSGALGRLESVFNRDAVDAFASLDHQITSCKGATKTKLKEQQKKQFPNGKPISQRPVISLHQGYRELAAPASSSRTSVYDANFIVLRQHEDVRQTFGLESTAQLVDALRNKIMSTSGIQPVPRWVSGHESTGERLQSGSHMAIVPLAFVESEYADGHLMGLGILVPNDPDITLSKRGKVFSPLLFDADSGLARTISLILGPAGVWEIIRDSASTTKHTLRTQTYTDASFLWASVTPVVLDRMPKTDRMKDPIGWREEVAAIVSKSCENVDLPAPIAVRVEKTPFFRGSLRAMPGQGGFPQLRKGRFQVHAQIEFAEPVAGPVLIGAGRFRGYGLMRPWRGGSQ